MNKPIKPFSFEWWRNRWKWSIIMRNVYLRNENIDQARRYEKLSKWIERRVNYGDY